MVKKFDIVEKAEHYNAHPSGVECIEVVASMSFCLGNAYKYVFRAAYKQATCQDYKKALYYVKRALADPPAHPVSCSIGTRRHQKVLEGTADRLQRTLLFSIHGAEFCTAKAEREFLLKQATLKLEDLISEIA